MQAQIQALIIGEVEGAGAEKEAMESNMRSQMEIVKLPVFNGEAGRVGEFITTCKLYLRMKIREAMVEEQVQ